VSGYLVVDNSKRQWLWGGLF